jgi:hypothetical protein
VHQLARALAFIALRGLQAEPPSRPIPIRVRMPETVESAIPKSSAISDPVNLSRRNAAIASIRRSSVRLATCSGAELKSSRPLSPQAR